MSLFDTKELEVCPRCKGTGFVYDAKIDADRPCPACSEPFRPDPRHRVG
jgi:predicted Zn-ribbon and HTH transcriptional regulator